MRRTMGPTALLLAFSLFAAGDPSPIAPAPLAVVPRPASAEARPGAFVLSDDVIRALDSPPLAAGSDGGPFVLRIDGTLDLGEEGYELDVTPERATLSAATPAGLFRGSRTVLQLLDPATKSIPACRVVDRPRFPWRGMHLDVCRHFFPVSFVKRYVDVLAYHKMNVFHWHLTEDQGWRIAIEKYPKLTEVGAWRDEGGKRAGGFYTKDEIREVVAYAAARHVKVVPEIELPGHALAALAAYPELSCTGGPFAVATRWGVFDDVYCAGNDATLAFLEDVLAEVCDLFPGEFVHVGGDECPKTRWKSCAKCQARIRNEGLKDEQGLQSWVIRRMERFLASRGKRLVGWDEILEGGLPPNATVMSWRGTAGGAAAAREGHDVVMAPTTHCYFDFAQSDDPDEFPPGSLGVLPLERVYAFEPIPEGLAEDAHRRVLGGQGNVWTERMTDPAEVEFMALPRLCALSEVLWSPREARGWDDFRVRLAAHFRRLDALGVAYRVPTPEGLLPVTLFTDSAELRLSTPFPGAVIRYTGDFSEPKPSSHAYEKPVVIKQDTLVAARLFLPGGRASRTVRGVFEKATPREAVVVGAPPTPGADARYFEGPFEAMPDFSALAPARSLRLGGAGVPEGALPERFALEITGLFAVPEDGVYTLHVTSDDGSRLHVGDTLVVDNDGIHGPRERSGPVALRRGFHPLRVAYFNAGGSARLEVDVSGPGLPRRRLETFTASPR